MIENYFKTLSVVGSVPFIASAWYLGKVADVCRFVEKHVASEPAQGPKLKVVK